MEIKSKCFLVSVKRLKRVRNCYDIKSLPKDKIIYADCLEDINTKVLEIIRAERDYLLNLEGSLSRPHYDLKDCDYEYTIEKLNYIVLEDESAIELSKKVNKHLEKGWEVLGGIQIGGSGGDSSDYKGWSEWKYVQSLVCRD